MKLSVNRVVQFIIGDSHHVPMVSLSLDVSPQHHRTLIGSGGGNIRAIMERSNTTWGIFYRSVVAWVVFVGGEFLRFTVLATCTCTCTLVNVFLSTHNWPYCMYSEWYTWMVVLTLLFLPICTCTCFEFWVKVYFHATIPFYALLWLCFNQVMNCGWCSVHVHVGVSLHYGIMLWL